MAEEHSGMARIYYKQVIEGKRTIEEVPELWREEVDEMLREDKE